MFACLPLLLRNWFFPTIWPYSLVWSIGNVIQDSLGNAYKILENLVTNNGKEASCCRVDEQRIHHKASKPCICSEFTSTKFLQINADMGAHCLSITFWSSSKSSASFRHVCLFISSSYLCWSTDWVSGVSVLWAYDARAKGLISSLPRPELHWNRNRQ